METVWLFHSRRGVTLPEGLEISYCSSCIYLVDSMNSTKSILIKQQRAITIQSRRYRESFESFAVSLCAYTMDVDCISLLFFYFSRWSSRKVSVVLFDAATYPRIYLFSLVFVNIHISTRVSYALIFHRFKTRNVDDLKASINPKFLILLRVVPFLQKLLQR